VTIYDYINKGDFIEAIMVGNSVCELTIGVIYEVTEKNKLCLWIKDDRGMRISIGKDSTAAKDWFKLFNNNSIEKNVKDVDFLDLLKRY
jgi:hypothetical protein